jgi:hypothetical protein
MTAANKRLVISESHGDLNRYTPCRGKPNQHATRFPHSVHVWSMTIRISHGPHIASFHTVVNRFEQIHCTQEEGLLTQSTAHWPTNPQVRIQLLSHNSHWSSGKSQASVDNWLLGLPSSHHRHAIGTFNTYSRGPTERSLIDTGGGYNLGGASLPRINSPTFPTICLHFPLVAPSGLQFNQVLTMKSKFWF